MTLLPMLMTRSSVDSIKAGKSNQIGDYVTPYRSVIQFLPYTCKTEERRFFYAGDTTYRRPGEA
jgi:hypothetical protein